MEMFCVLIKREFALKPEEMRFIPLRIPFTQSHTFCIVSSVRASEFPFAPQGGPNLLLRGKTQKPLLLGLREIKQLTEIILV